MKRRFAGLFLGGALAVIVCPSGGFAADGASVHVESAWLRSAKPGQDDAHLFMMLHNDGDVSDKLVSVSSKRFGKAVIHADPSRIVVPHGIVIPPHASVLMEPGRPNISLHDPRGETVVDTKEEVQLVFEKAGPVAIEAVVAPADALHANDAEARERWKKASSQPPAASGDMTGGADEQARPGSTLPAPTAN